MDTKNFRGLMEAYVDVYAPQENIEEGLRSAVKRLLGGKKEAEAPKPPQGRTAQLRQRHGITARTGPESPRGRILDRMQQQIDADARKHGPESSAVQASTAARKQMLGGGYSQFGMNDARGRGNKAKKRAAALNKEEFEFIVNALIEEGYDLSSYTWDEMYEICLDEAITSEKGKAKAAEMIAARTTASGRAKPGQGDNVATIRHIIRSNRDGILGTPPNRKVAGRNWPKSYTGTGGTGNKAARRAGLTPTREKPNAWKEEVDLYDIILSHLLDEGYAETLEEAEWMMANVIDEEAIEIVLGEAQAARENPEKYEREQRKKYAPVRGERTPMPPRGDKHREDFEKWYAANVR